MNKASPSLVSLFHNKRDVYLRVLTRRLGNADAAEETLQEAFIHFDKAEKSGEITNPGGYLMQIALNLAVDRIRQDQSRKRREENWFEAHSAERSGLEYVAQSPAPDRSLMAKDELARLSRSLDELSTPVRKAFVLHKIRGLSHSETASELGLSRSTIEKHIMKAMRHILDKMEDRDA